MTCARTGRTHTMSEHWAGWAALEAGVDGGDGQVGLPGEGNVVVAQEVAQVLGQATVPQALHLFAGL